VDGMLRSVFAAVRGLGYQAPRRLASTISPSGS